MTERNTKTDINGNEKLKMEHQKLTGKGSEKKGQKRRGQRRRGQRRRDLRRRMERNFKK